MAEKILSKPVHGTKHEIRYLVRWQPTGRTAKRIGVVLLTDVFRVLGYAEPSQSASTAVRRAAECGRNYARRPIVVSGTARTVVTTTAATEMVVTCTGRDPRKVLATLDALKAIDDEIAALEALRNENI